MRDRTFTEFDLFGKLAFRIPHVAYILSMSVSKVERLLRSKELDCIKDEGVTLITRRQLRSYLSRKEREGR